MIVRHDVIERGEATGEIPQSKLRIEVYHAGRLFDEVTLDAKPGKPDPRPQWIEDYNAMMQPVGLSARLPKGE